MPELSELPVESQKMEMVGRLANAVVHDLNNLLTVIQLNASILETDSTSAEQTQLAASQIRKACNHASELTRGILSFARGSAGEKSHFKIGQFLSDLIRLLSVYVSKITQLKTELADGDLWVKADKTALNQAVMNLIFNAVDAAPRQGITLSAREVTVPGHAGRNFVEITVIDDGSGIPPEILSRIFEPFYTTKDLGKGTGMGLPIVKAVIERQGGWVSTESTVGEGSTFRLFIPRSNEDGEADSSTPQAAAPASGSPTILLVESDLGVRSITRRILEGKGYRALEAGNASETREQWKNHQDEISLALMDLALPDGVSGIDIAAELSQQKPNLKVLYSSGNEAMIRDNPALNEQNFLPKPFTQAALLEKLHAVLA
jgi:two-component system cell cycle sensor histidine kinase/response regulator CckA